MSTITWPSDLQDPQTVSWGIKPNTQVMVSPGNGSIQTLELPGARWQVDFSYAPSTEAQAAIMQAWIMTFRGQANRVALYNAARHVPRGTAGGTPLVNGAGQTGASIVTDGWTPGATFLRGDFFSFNSELKMATADCAADGSGNMTIPFEPPMRSSPADNAAITTTKPTALFIPKEPEVRWTTRPGKFTTFELSFVEAFA